MDFRRARAERHRAPTEPKLGHHLSKSLQHSQVVPATMSTDAGHTTKLSSTGGLRGASTHHTHGADGLTTAGAPHDKKILMRRNAKYVHQPAHATKGK